MRKLPASTKAELASAYWLCRGQMGKVTGLSDAPRSGLSGFITGQTQRPGGGLVRGNY